MKITAHLSVPERLKELRRSVEDYDSKVSDLRDRLDKAVCKSVGLDERIRNAPDHGELIALIYDLHEVGCVLDGVKSLGPLIDELSAIEVAASEKE